MSWTLPRKSEELVKVTYFCKRKPDNVVIGKIIIKVAICGLNAINPKSTRRFLKIKL